MEKKEYRTYGSAAYAPERSPREQERTPTKPKKVTQGRPSVRPIHRKRVEVREAGSMSLDSIFGFIVGLALAAVLMSGYAELATNSDQVVQLRSRLNTLQSQQQILSAQYEKHFDIGRIEDSLGNHLIRPTNEQMVYIDLSQPDTVEMFGTVKSEGFFTTLWNIFVHS